jgi:UDP-2,3-diacylglucosamine hydrolase
VNRTPTEFLFRGSSRAFRASVVDRCRGPPRRATGRLASPTFSRLRLPRRAEPSIFGAVLGETLVVVADAHLGVTPPVTEEALLSFLETVPDLGDCLLVNGDLFDFWFSYARVVPRRGFHVAAALARLGRRVPIVMVGGNHDRWGGDFWARDIGVRFEPRRATFEVGRRRVAAIHGDGLTEPRLRATLLHRAINHPITAAVFRAIHPELGLRIVDALSPHLGDHTPDAAKLADAAARQREWAAALLARETDLGLVIMGHTHQPALEEISPGQQYLNPGAWFDGFRYAVVGGSGAELRRFNPAAPLPPVPTAPR